MNAIKTDVDLVASVLEEHRSWLAHSEIDLLHDFETQAWSGWCLSAHQRRLVDRLAETARDRREMAVSLTRTAS